MTTSTARSRRPRPGRPSTATTTTTATAAAAATTAASAAPLPGRGTGPGPSPEELSPCATAAPDPLAGATTGEATGEATGDAAAGTGANRCTGTIRSTTVTVPTAAGTATGCSAAPAPTVASPPPPAGRSGRLDQPPANDAGPCDVGGQVVRENRPTNRGRSRPGFGARPGARPGPPAAAAPAHPGPADGPGDTGTGTGGVSTASSAAGTAHRRTSDRSSARDGAASNGAERCSSAFGDLHGDATLAPVQQGAPAGQAAGLPDTPAGPAAADADCAEPDEEALAVDLALEREFEELTARLDADDVKIDQLTALLSRKAKADATRTSYARHFASFRTWCEQRGASALPATTQSVLRHLTSIAVARDGDGQFLMTDDDRFQRGLHVSTVQVRMYAIDYAHKQAGLPRPSQDPAVQTLMQGLRRVFSVAPDEQRAPVEIADLGRLVSACSSPGLEMLVRQAARALARATGATPGQLTRLDWVDVDIPPTLGRATLSLTRTDVSRKRIKLVIKARAGAPDCPVAALVLLRALSGDTGPVLRNVRGRRLAVQSVRRILGRGTPGRAERPADATALRDSVLILLGWWSAVRRGNLTRLLWSHLDFRLADTEGVLMRLPSSKSDQEGRGAYKALLRVDEAPALCPVRALQSWREHLTRVLGRDPITMKNLPVLLQVDRHGSVHLPATLSSDTVGLSGLAINRRIQVLADRCGLTADAKQMGYGNVRHPFGGHSLRAGWLSSFVRAGGALHDGAKQLDHVKLDTTKAYARSITALSSSPSHLLLTSLAEAQAAASRSRLAPAPSSPRVRRTGSGRPRGR